VDPARHGTPKSYEQAIDLWNTIHRQPEESVSEKIAAFGEEFGQFIDNSCEESWLNVLGGTGAYARACRTAVLRLELPDTDWQPVLVELVEIANKHGLVVLDEQGVTVFLPNGKVLPAGRAKGWNGLKAALKEEGGFPQTLGQFKKWLTPQVEMMLARHGDFVQAHLPTGDKQLGYVNTNGESSMYIYLTFEGSGGLFGFDIKFDITNNSVYEVMSKFNFKFSYTVCRGGIITDIFSDKPYTDYYVNSYARAFEVLYAFEHELFPAFKNFVSIKGLDDLLNGRINNLFSSHFHNFVFKPQCLILARLAGNPYFEEIAVELAVDSGWFANEGVWKEEWPKLVKYLREEVQPVV